jgi:enoyl-CoA hydratase/carnithine racemase
VSEAVVLVDEPMEKVRRLTLNRPEKRNALSNGLRRMLFDELRAADADAEVSVIVIRGAGGCFSAGYDLAQDPSEPPARPAAPLDGWWARHVVDGWLEMWDMATPIVGQVHGYCLAGATELAAACDLLYVAEDAQIGYPPVRLMSPPDMTWQPWLMGMRKAMEYVLTGDSMSGLEAVEQGVANAAFPEDALEAGVLAACERIVKVPIELLALNKRVVRRAMEQMGMRNGVRATADIQPLGFHQAPSKAYLRSFTDKGVKEALSERDRAFGDYRESR